MNKEDLLAYKEKLSKLSELEQRERDLYLRRLALGEIEGPPVGYASIDKPWLKYYNEEKINNSVKGKSIYQYALEQNKKNMFNVALDVRVSKNDFKYGVKITYREFFANIMKFAKSLKAINTSINEIIPVILPNIPEARYAIYGNSVIGSISYPISPLLPTNDLERIIDDNNIKTVFIFEDFYNKYKGALKNLEHIILLNGTESLPKMLKLLRFKTNYLKKYNDSRIISYDDFIRNGIELDDVEPYYSENHVTTIIGTSGTTGIPKGVCLTDDNINGVGSAYIDGEYFDGNFMDALIPSIGYGISMIHYQTCSGRYVYLIPELLTDKFPAAVAKINPDNFPGGPVHYINIFNSEEYKNGEIKSHENFISGGASLPKSIEQGLNKVEENYCENGVNDDLFVRQGYGLSENTAMGAFNKKGTYKFGSIGIPIIHENVAIVEPGTSNELTYNEPGEIIITGPSVMKEYLNNQSETDKVIKILEDGKRWIYTKDIGYIDEDGNIFHVDRIKNIFMRNGFNVHPTKIAEYINTIDYVKNCAVIGYEHPKEQGVPVAFVELDDEKISGFSHQEIKSDLMRLCYDNLEETSVPVDFVFVDSLPINVGGKVDLPLIKEISKIDFYKEDKVLCKSLKFKK